MATFAEALYSLPTEQLRTIAIKRDLPLRRVATAADKRQLVQYLAAELSKPPSISQAVMKCNARELRLLQLIVSMDARRGSSWTAILDAAGGPELDAPLSIALHGLEDLGLVQREGDAVFVQEVVRQRVPTTLSDRYKLASCLHNYDAVTLKQIAERLGTEGSTKSDNVEAIARRLLFANEGLFGSIPLDREEQAVLDYLIQMGGAAAAVDAASDVLHNTDDFFRYDWQNRWKMGKSRNAIDRLLARGMVFVVSYAYGFNLFLVIPGDLLRALTGESNAGYWTAAIPKPTHLAGEPQQVHKHTNLTRDVITLFAFVTTQEAARTNTGYMHKTSLKNLAKSLSIQDDRYAALLYALCRQNKLIAPSSEKHLYAVTRAGHEWMSLGPLEQHRNLYEAWRQGGTWGEMFNDPLKRANEYRNVDAIVSVRSAALRLVADHAGDEFIDLESLTEAFNFNYPLLLAQISELGDDLVTSPASFLRILVGDCLYRLGIVELCRVAEPGGIARQTPPVHRSSDSLEELETSLRADGYRLTTEGAWLLNSEGAREPEEPPTEAQFILQPNSEVFLSPYLDSKTLFNLLLIAEPPGKAGSRNIVSLTRESIRRALDLGISARQITDFLQSSARMGIPQNVEYLIKEVGEKHGHIHIGRAQMYLHVDSPLILQELQARRELKGYFVRTLGDHVAILNAPEPDKLLKELRKAGYLPISDDHPKGHNLIEITGKTSRVKSARKQEAQPPRSDKAISEEPEVDWERFARDDGRLWRESGAQEVPQTRPEDAVRDKGNIRFVMLDAIRKKVRVQIAYQGQTDSAPQVRTLEPLRVSGNFVLAYLPLDAEEVMLNINRIAWARPTNDVFSAP